MKKLIAIIIAVVVIGLCCVPAAAGDNTTTSEAYIPSETEMNLTEETVVLEPMERPRVETDDLTMLTELREDASKRMIEAHTMAEGARGLSYEEAHPVIELAKAEWGMANEDFRYYSEKLTLARNAEEEKFYADKSAEYPAATYVWLFLKEQGFSDQTCAGIIGNFMAEVGGQTLNLQYMMNNGNGYYGMAQWSKKYFPGVIGADLQGQCEFLMGNIEETFKIYGKNYRSGFTYEEFTQMTNEKEAALAFAKVYERCASAHYGVRQKNATKALAYFTSAPTADAQ